MKDTIKALLRRKLRNLWPPDAFEFLVHHVNRTGEGIDELVAERGLPMGQNFARFRTSDTLFVLGSGPSINRMTDDQWAHVGRHDSIGFNYFLIHPFVATMYFMQFRDKLQTIYKKRADELSDRPIVFRGQSMSDPSNRPRELIAAHPADLLYYVNEFALHGAVSLPPREIYDFMERLGLLTSGTITPLMPKPRSTVIALTLFAYQMGYSRLVFCGTDMKDDRHFWDEGHWPETEFGKLAHRGPDPMLARFNDADFNPYTVPRYLADFADWANERREMEFLCGSAETVLVEHFRVHDWD